MGKVNFGDAKLVSSEVMAIYSDLIDAAMMEEENDFYSLLIELEEKVSDEKKIYASFKNSKDIRDNMIQAFNCEDLYSMRFYRKLDEQLNHLYECVCDEDGILFDEIIKGKVILEALKKMYFGINKMSFEGLSLKKVKNFQLYFIGNMFDYFANNTYLEKMGLEYAFNFDKIPDISIDGLERKYHINLTTICQGIYLEMALCDIETLEDLDIMPEKTFHDEYEREYDISYCLYEFATLYDLLNKDNLKIVKDRLNNAQFCNKGGIYRARSFVKRKQKEDK